MTPLAKAVAATIATAALFTGYGAAVAHAGPNSPGCVSKTEFASVASKPGHFAPVALRRRTINRRFGAVPFRVQEGKATGFWGSDAVWRAQDYRSCDGAVVSVEFMRAPLFVNLQRFRSIDIYKF